MSVFDQLFDAVGVSPAIGWFIIILLAAHIIVGVTIFIKVGNQDKIVQAKIRAQRKKEE